MSLWSHLSRTQQLGTVIGAVISATGVVVAAVLTNQHSASPSPPAFTSVILPQTTGDGGTGITTAVHPLTSRPSAVPAPSSDYVAEMDAVCHSWAAQFEQAKHQGGLEVAQAMAAAVRQLDDSLHGLTVPAAVRGTFLSIDRAYAYLQQSQDAALGGNFDDANRLAHQAALELQAFGVRSAAFGAGGCAEDVQSQTRDI